MESKTNIEKLREKIYGISYSGFPLDSFFNDIEKNDNPKYNKELAYKDLELIVDKINELTKTPTEEEIIKEWEALEWKRIDIDEYILFINNKDKEKRIIINDVLKRYFVTKGYLSFKEHQLLTKTFKMLGWKI